jgi:glycosyltransferase involved in cell wall biosynthesis
VKISIITATYNSTNTIQGAIDSVRNQDYSNIEHIIIDGESSDSTIDILQNNKSSLTTWISEKDAGIYDALNKGIRLATGDVVGILHSDDEFESSKTITKVADEFTRDSKIDACYGDLQYVDQTNTDRVIRNWKSCDYKPELFYRGWMPAHPTFFLKRSLFVKNGFYNLDFFTAADYELMLRMMVKHKISSAYIPEVLVKMRVGGQSNVSWRNRWIANQEDARAWRINGLRPKFYTRWLKPISKLGQFFQ